jgi:N-acetylglucosaminyl-diphospho-decaprenol L-rhamnosyltransferase
VPEPPEPICESQGDPGSRLTPSGSAACVDVVIVNWNAGAQLRECLSSLPAACQRGCRLSSVTIVDNASIDGSVDDVAIPDLPLRVLRNPVNRGFAAACNQGASDATGDYVLFLNPDTVLEPGSLAAAVAALESAAHRQAAVAGIQLYDETREVSRTCTRFPSPRSMVVRALGLDRVGWVHSYWMKDWPHDRTRVVDHVIGAFYLVRRQVFEDLQGFDERFFVYLEDLDFSLRVHQAGWQSVYVADARAFHKGGGMSQRVPARRLAYALRSRLVYADKHFNASGRLLVRTGTLAVEPVIRLAHAALRLSSSDMVNVAAAYRLLWSGPRN